MAMRRMTAGYPPAVMAPTRRAMIFSDMVYLSRRCSIAGGTGSAGCASIESVAEEYARRLQRRNTGVSPLRHAMKLGGSGRDDDRYRFRKLKEMFYVRDCCSVAETISSNATATGGCGDGDGPASSYDLRHKARLRRCRR